MLKRILAVLCALSMALCLGAGAFASAEEAQAALNRA